MNWAEIEGNWTRLCPLLKSYWPNLTDDTLGRIDGRREALADCLRRLYGYGPDEAEREIAAFEKDVRFPGAVK
jgi:uncharacterized protein YjbJ (UPF0337 family)